LCFLPSSGSKKMSVVLRQQHIHALRRNSPREAPCRRLLVRHEVRGYHPRLGHSCAHTACRTLGLPAFIPRKHSKPVLKCFDRMWICLSPAAIFLGLGSIRWNSKSAARRPVHTIPLSQWHSTVGPARVPKVVPFWTLETGLLNILLSAAGYNCLGTKA
jgi:hypothetical protein